MNVPVRKIVASAVLVRNAIMLAVPHSFFDLLAMISFIEPVSNIDDTRWVASGPLTRKAQ
jgi:hypothetical protein